MIFAAARLPTDVVPRADTWSVPSVWRGRYLVAASCRSVASVMLACRKARVYDIDRRWTPTIRVGSIPARIAENFGLARRCAWSNQSPIEVALHDGAETVMKFIPGGGQLTRLRSKVNRDCISRVWIKGQMRNPEGVRKRSPGPTGTRPSTPERREPLGPMC